MCGIVGGIAESPIETILLAGLKRLEYRGYDSAGITVLDDKNTLQRVRCKGKIHALETALAQNPLTGNSGIAHTRWATHGVPSEQNAHPFVSHDTFSIVHNGIIENYAALREKLMHAGYLFTSDTDSETIVHLLHFYYEKTKNFLTATQHMVAELEGAYAIAILSTHDPDTLIAVRHGSPLVIGKNPYGYFLASDPLALLSVTRQFVYLEDGDIATIQRQSMTVYAADKKVVTRKWHDLAMQSDPGLRQPYRHYMQQEIFSQPDAFRACLSAYDQTGLSSFPTKETISHIQLVACGTSYHAALVARYWLEAWIGIPCAVETASEYRYRDVVIPKNTLAIFLSQSGETADTLAAAERVKKSGNAKIVAICNVAESSLMRLADYHLLTHAGAEIGVASTKAFTTQLLVLLLFMLSLKPDNALRDTLKTLPTLAENMLSLNAAIEKLAKLFIDKTNTLFIGRHTLFPIALEGALKLKEISYIHAEGYPAGELKHGPLALIEKNMPVIALAPHDALFAKLCGSLSEIRARDGYLIVLTDNPTAIQAISADIHCITLPKVHPLLAPILYTLPLQLLAYHVAILKGTDVDQPRNLAKSVTVE